MRMLVYAALFLLAGGAAALLLRGDSGYALLAYDVWTVELSLATLALIILLLFALLYLLTRFMLGTLGLPARYRDWRSRRGAQQAQKSLTAGLLEMAEGKWPGSEQLLLKNIDQSETPLLNYLSAARAAQLQGAHERQEHYIRLAHQHMPSANVAVSLTQAELQLASNQLEQALATLQELHKMAPRHSYVLSLLASTYEQLGDWEQLKGLLPELRKQKVRNDAELDALEIRIHRALLAAAARSIEPTRLETVWHEVPKNLQKSQLLVLDYSRYLHQRDQDGIAEPLLRKSLSRQWNEEVVALYGELEGEQADKQLSAAETLLSDHPRNGTLLLTLGRLSLRAKLWGKARSYLEASIGVNGPASAYRELGHLLEVMGEEQEALEIYRRGVLGFSGPAAVSLPSHIGRLTNLPPLDESATAGVPPYGAGTPAQEAPSAPQRTDD